MNSDRIKIGILGIGGIGGYMVSVEPLDSNNKPSFAIAFLVSPLQMNIILVSLSLYFLAGGGLDITYVADINNILWKKYLFVEINRK